MATICVKRIGTDEVVKQFDTEFTGARLQKMIDGLCRNMDMGKFSVDAPDAMGIAQSEYCAQCGSRNLSHEPERGPFKYGDCVEVEQIQIVWTCNTCHFQWTGWESELLNEVAVREALLRTENAMMKSIIVKLRRAEEAVVGNTRFMDQDEAFFYLNGQTQAAAANAALRRATGERG